MSASQIILAALVVVAFVLGWLARGRRERPAARRGRRAKQVGARHNELLELDRTLGEALTAFQAMLAVWQLEGRGVSPLGQQALATYDRQHAAARALASSQEPSVQPLIGRALSALDAMASGLADYAAGGSLDGDRERSLMRAERALTGARHSLLVIDAEESRL